MTVPILNPVNEVPAQMIMELAARIQPASEILARYEIDPVTFQQISKSQQFRAAYAEAKQFWNSDSNAKERIAIKAQAMVEDSLLELHTLFHDAAKNPTARLDALKTMMKLARVDAGEPKEMKDVGGRAVHIHIDMGAQRVEREISNVMIDNDEDYSDD